LRVPLILRVYECFSDPAIVSPLWAQLWFLHDDLRSGIVLQKIGGNGGWEATEPSLSIALVKNPSDALVKDAGLKVR
jgi:hypothetical protein